MKEIMKRKRFFLRDDKQVLRPPVASGNRSGVFRQRCFKQTNQHHQRRAQRAAASIGLLRTQHVSVSW